MEVLTEKKTNQKTNKPLIMEQILQIDPIDLHKNMSDLRKEGYDFLRSLTGMDWGEEGLGVVYNI